MGLTERTSRYKERRKPFQVFAGCSQGPIELDYRAVDIERKEVKLDQHVCGFKWPGEVVNSKHLVAFPQRQAHAVGCIADDGLR